jgi:peptidoglycan/LPS O-acetylase OafA/YrhL
LKSNDFHSATIPKERLLPGIHGLRGIAALSIVFYHLYHLTGINIPEIFKFIARDFGYGAHLFFVLSAFSLMHSTECTMSRSNWTRDYFIKRFFRIAPLFYLLIVFVLTGQIVAHGKVVDIPTILLNVFFVFGFTPSSGIVWGGWTVGVEMIFYVLFPVLLIAIRTTRTSLIYLFAAVFISCVSRYIFHEQYLRTIPLAQYDWWGYFSFLPNLFFFVIGICAFKLKNTFTRESIALRFLIPLIAVVIVGVLLLSEMDKPLRSNSGRLDLLVWGIGFGALCIWQSIRPGFWSANKIFRYVGERSYSMYLLHPVIIVFLKGYIIKFYVCLVPYVGAYAFFICSIIVLGIVLIVAEIAYRTIEVPGIKLGRTFIGRLQGLAS